MNKVKLEQYDNKTKDFLFWIKIYIASKIYKLKPNRDANDFEKEKSHNLILGSMTIDELRSNSNLIAQSIPGLRNYSSPLINFYNYVIKDDGISGLKNIDTEYINSYTKLNSLSPNYYVQIRSLFKFIDSNLLDNFKFDIGLKEDGSKAVLPIKMNKEKVFNHLESKDFEKFILSIEYYKTNHPNPFLLKLMVKFFCFGGFKADEVQHIKESDICFKDLNDKTYIQVRILEKENKEKLVYILYDLIKYEYENYLITKKQKVHLSEYLFYTREFAMFSIKRIYDIVKDFHNKSGLEIKNFNYHSLRKTYSVILHSLNVPLETISILLGYSAEEKVEFYVFASKAESKEISSSFKFI